MRIQQPHNYTSFLLALNVALLGVGGFRGCSEGQKNIKGNGEEAHMPLSQRSSAFSQTPSTSTVSVESLVALAKSPDASQRARALNSIRSVQPISLETVDTLVNTIKTSDSDIQGAALFALEHVSKNGIGLKNKYIELLSDSDIKVQIAGMKGVEVLKAQEAAPEVRVLLERHLHHKFSKIGFLPPVSFKDVSYQHEDQAMRTLIALGDERSIDQILSRDELVILGNASILLSKRFGAMVLPKLAMIVKDKNDSRGMSADRAIVAMEDEAAVPQLAQMLKDPDLRLSAVYALGTISGNSLEARQILEGEYSHLPLKEKMTCLQKLLIAESGWGIKSPAIIKPATLIKLKNLISDALGARDSLVEYQIINCLVVSRDPHTVPVLEHYLKDPLLPQRDYSLDDRVLAAWGLWKITGRRYAVPVTKPNERKWSEDKWNQLEEEESQREFNKTKA